MSKAAKAPDLTFENALEKLESIVETMEGGDLPLEQLLGRYEEGTRLVQFCQERLAAVELRIQQLDPNPNPNLNSGSASPRAEDELADLVVDVSDGDAHPDVEAERGPGGR